MRARALARAALALAAAAGANAGAQTVGDVLEGGGIQLFVENDKFALFGRTDQWYTNGIRVVVLPRNQDQALLDLARRSIPGLFSEDQSLRLGFAFGQDIYTPKDIGNPDPQPWDRPWAGWLYAGVIAQVNDAFQSRTLELDLGAVGPASQAERVQVWWHRVIGADEPRGWANQLANEPGFVLSYRHQLRYQLKCDAVDLIPSVSASVGNVFTGASAGATLRVGANMTGFGDDRRGNTMLASRRAPTRLETLGGTLPECPEKRRERWEWYAFARAEGRLVAHNITLDGNTFRESASVDKRWLVGEVSVGFSVRFAERYRFTFSHNRRTYEFHPVDERTDRSIPRYGSLVFSCEYRDSPGECLPF